jgi:DNA-binding NarL/FixJ family response regulator
MRLGTSPGNSARLFLETSRVDVCDLAREVRCPTLVLHARGDSLVPYAEGQLMATLIPGAEFVTLDSANHVILEEEPAWEEVVAELRRFLPQPATVEGDDGTTSFSALSERERQVLELLAQGLGNEQIAQRLSLSPRTVRNHVTSIFAKADLTSRAQAIVRARDAGYGRGATFH